MKRKIKRIIALALSVLMMLSLAACQGKETEEKSVGDAASSEVDSKMDVEDVTELSWYVLDNSGDASSAPWFFDYINEKFGVKVEICNNAGEDVMPAYLASGELPDIVLFGDKEYVKAAADGGMLVNFDDYKDLMPNIFGNEDLAAGLDFMRNDMNGQYAIPYYVGPAKTLESDPVIRWDVYKDQGYPEVTDYDQLLEVLKQMVDAYPETKEGLTTYGLGLFGDWDGQYLRNSAFYYINASGHSIDFLGGLAEVIADGSSEPVSILDDNSSYKASLDWLFKANQMGLLDPESVSMKYEDYDAKASAGQYMLLPFGWWSYGDAYAEDFEGYKSLFVKDAPVMLQADYVTGGGYYYGISSSCKNIEKAIKVLDWLYSNEGNLMYYRGPEGVLWEMKDGKAVYTETLLDAWKDGTYNTTPFNGGGTLQDLYMVTGVGALTGFAEDPATGQAYDLLLVDQLKLQEIGDSNMDKDWKAHYGEYASTYDLRVDKGNFIQMDIALKFVPVASDDIITLTGQIGAIVKENSWKMVFAKDQAEFDALWAETQDDAEALGIEQVIEDAKSRYAEAVKIATEAGMYE